MTEPLDGSTKEALCRLCKGADPAGFSLAEKSAMVLAWRKHVTREVVPSWGLGISFVFFLLLVGKLGLLFSSLLCVIFYIGISVGVRLLFDKVADHYSCDELLKPTKNWALKQSLDSGVSRNEKNTDIPYGWIALGVILLLAMLTVPGKEKHEAEIRTAVSEEIARYKADSLGKVAAKWIFSAINQNLQEDPHLSYIDTMGYEYRKILIFSTVRSRAKSGQESEVISVGFFNQVYVFKD